MLQKSNKANLKSLYLTKLLEKFLGLNYHILMRIISGKYRGKKLQEFDLQTTKPTLDRVKESMFNLIQFDIADAVVCDLFAGTGALGIECISRGAKMVYLVDNNPKAIKIINANLKNIDGNFKVENKDSVSFLTNTNTKFDIVLIDPPYRTNLGVEAIEYIAKNNRLNKNGIIIFETSKELDFNFDYPQFDIDKRTYGTVAVYKFVLKD